MIGGVGVVLGRGEPVLVHESVVACKLDILLCPEGLLYCHIHLVLIMIKDAAAQEPLLAIHRYESCTCP